MRVLAVDPGRQKCGLAVCAPGTVLAHQVVPTGSLADLARQWADAYEVDLAVVGSGTGAPAATAALSRLGLPLVAVAERGTTLAARERYFLDHPPRGWRRLLPRTLQVPPEPYDDYSAILLAECFLAKKADHNTINDRS